MRADMYPPVLVLAHSCDNGRRQHRQSLYSLVLQGQLQLGVGYLRFGVFDVPNESLLFLEVVDGAFHGL